METSQHCPGFEPHRYLKSLTVKCPRCEKEEEVFSDESDKIYVCKECHEEMHFIQIIDASNIYV